MENKGYNVLWTSYARVALAHTLQEVHVDACYFANTGSAHHIFWGIDPDEE
jgi:hypothetical protein